ncbi:MAG: mycothiol system anti-sigma-R factor [Acidimicrobiia bacterium]|nr:mycothiol system anti-sigma-R factor [Acidimicrobiia bacterium]MDH5238451.1 mycothiol system anti-sigma-R factor [Acidimicrobiia bacterium]
MAAECDEPNCNDALHELYEYIDGELDDDRREAIHDHLDKCGHCLDAFDFEEELRKVVAQRCRDSVPDALRARIAAQLEIATD